MSTIKKLIEIGGEIKPEEAARGVLPLVLKHSHALGEKQVILSSSFEEASLLYDSLEMFGKDDYVLIDSSSSRFAESALYALKTRKSVVTDNQIKSNLFPKESGESLGLWITKNERISIEKIQSSLENIGFQRVDNVYERGEYALRGFILDIFGYNGECARVEFYDDTVEDIRVVDVETQESNKKINSLFIPSGASKNLSEEFNNFFKDYKFYDTDRISESSNINTALNENIKPVLLNHGSMMDYIREHYSKSKVTVLCSNEYEEERVKKILPKEASYIRGNLPAGFYLPLKDEIYINDFEIFSRRRFSRFHEIPLSPVTIEEIDSLNLGDIVVHQIYGVGKYSGIERVHYGERHTDCIKIFFDNNDKLFVPVDQIRLVSKYVGSGDKEPKLSSLSKNSFEKQKEKVRESVKKIAGELLRLYAEREVVKGFKFASDDEKQIEMEELFEHEETEDQIKAIMDVKRDMMSEKPMDRLISGEVGFGKTEVAARAAFKAHLSKKQVAFLVPTTILAEQHYETLCERLSSFNVKIEVLSRFRNDKEKHRIKQMVREGDVDIIIGTHALLARDMEFFDLGLYIIDEEHRFGVKQKERIKELKKNIDVLAMSATPIPRTLEMALTGIKDITNIMTPPAGRKAIKTFVVKWSEETVRTAVLKEMSRQGQVYFLHNRIETLKSVEENLKLILKEARIVSVHAKMHAKDIERKMKMFRNREYDILLSTAIIESGIDNPNVNTMVINRADMFGLAELHQLRGRIGRSNRESFCYLVVPEKEGMTENAKKRLSAFKSYSSLGAGINLAIKDVEMRGAGKILGTEQHGFIGSVGYTLYFKILSEAIDEVKGKRKVSLIEPTVNLPGSTYVPDDFNITKSGKMHLYRDVSSISKLDNIEREEEKFKDRYGRMPKEIKNIFMLQRIKLLCKEERIGKVEMSRNSMAIEFFTGYEPGIDKLKRFLSKIESPFEIKHQPSFTIIIRKEESKDAFNYAYNLLKFLPESDKIKD